MQLRPFKNMSWPAIGWSIKILGVLSVVILIASNVYDIYYQTNYVWATFASVLAFGIFPIRLMGKECEYRAEEARKSLQKAKDDLLVTLLRRYNKELDGKLEKLTGGEC